MFSRRRGTGRSALGLETGPPIRTSRLASVNAARNTGTLLGIAIIIASH
jgi:hypothetical protein